MAKFTFTPAQLENDPSGTHLAELRKNGYTACPIVKFGEYEYILMFTPIPHPGRNTADVINITELETPMDGETAPYFRVVRSDRYAFLDFEDEGFSMLAKTPDEEFYEYTNPTTAVLTYQIVPATSEQIDQTLEEMYEQSSGGM